MAQSCVSWNMAINSGVLGIDPISVPHFVFDATYSSTGDGSLTQQTTLPGKLMIDSGIQSWTNTSPLDAMLLVRIQRGFRDWTVSNPNAIQIRDRYTYTVNGASPRVPDPSSVYTGHSGSSVDISADYNGTPFAGVFYEWEDGTMIQDWITVPAGAVFKIWYKCYVWTPPPWSNNANNNSPVHVCNVRSARIQLMAFPTQDPDTVG